jgi:hypothetical protein
VEIRMTPPISFARRQDNADDASRIVRAIPERL